MVVVAMLAGASGLVVHLRSQSAASSDQVLAPIPAKLVINLQAAHLYCPTTLAWSPNGLQVAIAATSAGCGANPGARGAPLVGIFDARSGALRRVINTQALLPDLQIFTIDPATLAWSPDDTTIALLYPQSGPNPAARLLLLPANGKAGKSLTASPQTASVESLIWNLRSGSASAAPPVAPALTYDMYEWHESNGAAALSAASAGSGSFSFWQPGILYAARAQGNGALTVLVYAAATTAWSPDSQYLAAPFWVGALLAASPGLPSAQVFPGAFGHEPPFASAMHSQLAPDGAWRALIHDVLAQYGTSGASPQPLSYRTSVAWRPDHQVLAAILPRDDFFEGSGLVTLYSAATGERVATLAPDRRISSHTMKAIRNRSSRGRRADRSWRSPTSLPTK
ncbi:MAG: hypothetical protein ACHQ4H_11540 [Ktedonobacterales bacterium]